MLQLIDQLHSSCRFHRSVMTPVRVRRQLPADELTAFARWFEEYLAEAWDRRIEGDIKAGRLDEAGRRADADLEVLNHPASSHLARTKAPRLPLCASDAGVHAWKIRRPNAASSSRMRISENQ